MRFHLRPLVASSLYGFMVPVSKVVSRTLRLTKENVFAIRLAKGAGADRLMS